MFPVSPTVQALPASLSAAWIADALATVQAVYGIAPEEAMAGAGVDGRILAEPASLVSLVDALRIFGSLLVRTGDHTLGLQLGSRVQVRSYPVLGYIVMGSATLGDAIGRLLRFERIVGEVGRASLEEVDAAHVFLRWDCPLPAPYARYVTDAAVAGWVAVARAVIGQPRSPLEAHFAYPAPPPGEQDAYRVYFGCPVAFDAPRTGVLLSRELLALPLQSADPALRDIMEGHAAQLLADFSSGLNLANEVRSAIHAQLAGGEPDIAGVATALGMTARALQSRLRRANLTFSDLVDEVRRSLAAVLVADDRLSLVNVAMLLGFSEQSSFTRAFRRWYGMAPGEFRRQRG